VVETVRIEVPPALTDAGLNEPVAPAGNPLTERLTGRGAPDVACVVTVYVVLEPWTTVWLLGIALIAKSLRVNGVMPWAARCACAFARAKIAWSSAR
jgi:hypothetical protein